jgi:hypothetical protein
MSFTPSTVGCDIGVWKIDSGFKWWCQEHPDLQSLNEFPLVGPCLQAALFHAHAIHHTRAVVDLDGPTIRHLLHYMEEVSLAHRHAGR